MKKLDNFSCENCKLTFSAKKSSTTLCPRCYSNKTKKIDKPTKNRSNRP